MGLLPDIHCVWIAIDNKLFLWDYTHSQDISTFVDQPDVITHVAVVRPKPNVFVDDISSLMVLCTPLSILLIGLSTAPVLQTNRTEIKMYATNIEMSSVVATPHGCIFMAGSQDGCLYELHYQQSESWFGKKVHLINHSVGTVQSLFPRFSSPKSDSSSSLLPPFLSFIFPLDHIVSVVADPKCNCLCTLSAQEKAPASPAMNPTNFQIIALHVVDPAESHVGLQLMAITINGLRLYFSPTSHLVPPATLGCRLMWENPPPPPPPPPPDASCPLQLIHVRLPPQNLFHPDKLAHPSNRVPSSYTATRVPPPPTPSCPFIVSGL
ncbi:nucleoporin-domain-containing protein [Imleria badia]|nr:nucleoporin-domain-containing protein [Imleria badia]